MRTANVQRKTVLYATVVRTALADRLSWRGDIFLGTVFGAGRVFLALVLWTAVFDGRTEVGGMSLNLMASYYLVAVFLFQIDQSSVLANELAIEIRAGLLGKYLARPVNLMAWFLSVAFGRSILQAGATVGAALLVALILGPIGGVALGSVSILGTLAALPLAVLGLLCLALINFMTSILAFKFQEIGAFNIAKNCVVEFLSGALIPLALLPDWARRALGWTPFPSLASLPTDLMLGRGSASYARSLGVLVLWAFVLYGTARMLYRSLSEHYEELGS